eukprot:scaffold9278_cov117-Isochrysis_galbana.AAC.3
MPKGEARGARGASASAAALMLKYLIIPHTAPAVQVQWYSSGALELERPEWRRMSEHASVATLNYHLDLFVTGAFHGSCASARIPSINQAVHNGISFTALARAGEARRA